MLEYLTNKIPENLVKYKYYAVAAAFVLILVLIAYKSESQSVEELQRIERERIEEIQRLQRVKSEKSQLNPLMLGDKFYTRLEKGIGDKKANYINVIKYYSACADNNPTVCVRLANLFRAGLPDAYNNAGKKVVGIPPDANKAIYFYTKASQLGDGEALLKMADIYHWGLHDFQENKEYAKQLYLLLRKIGNNYQKGIAKDRLLQISEEDGSVIGGGIEGEGGLTSQFQESFENYGKNPLDDNFDTNLDSANATVDELSRVLNINHSKNQRPPNEKYEHNPDNVTDHVINNSIKQIINNLKANTALIMDVPTVFRDIKRWILAQRGNEDKKRDALKTLNEISKSINQRNYDEHKEIDCLQLVWNRIHANVNKTNKNILKQNLFNELAECVEYNDVVCRTGRIARFFDSLNLIDPLVTLKPKWMLKEEMMEKAAVLRDGAVKRAPAHIRDAVNSPHPSPDQIQLIQAFEDRFKKDLMESFEKEYVERGLMSKELLNTEIAGWLGGTLI